MRGHSEPSASKGQYETAAGHRLTASAGLRERQQFVQRSPLDVLPDDQLAGLAKACGASGSTARFEKADVQRPILNELHDRLTLALDRLSGGVSRIDVFADRVLGATPSEPTCASGGAGTTCAAESLHVVVAGIERMASRLHDAADRVERIG